MISRRTFIKDGYLTFFGASCVVLVGLGLIYLSLEFLPYRWLKIGGTSLGLAIAGIGGFNGRAHALGLPPPFTNDPLGWRKAKETYKTENEAAKPSAQGIFGKLARWLKR